MSLRACFPTVIASEAKQSQTAKRNVNNEDLTPRINNWCSGALVRWCAGKTGFTILELLVVLVIISMVVGMSIPAFSSYMRGSRLRTAAREISSTVMSARTQAITLREERVVFFKFADREFGIVGGEGQTLPPGIRFARFGDFPPGGIPLTPMGKVHGNPPYVITILSGWVDTDNDNVVDTNEPYEAKREITVGALGHVTIE